jgi:hypothetical protein
MSSLPNNLSQLAEVRPSLSAFLSFLLPFSGGAKKAGEEKAPTASRRGFELFEHVHADRALAEQFIGQRFAESFGSRVEAFMPRLFTLRNQDGEICGALGLRSASNRLFLEQYLDLPIEKAVAARAARPVLRQTLVEVGHFSGNFPGAVRAMIQLLTERLYREGFEWVTFTGTASLRNAFSRLGLSPLVLQAADVNRLPAEERAAWGSYYGHEPLVLVGNIKEGYLALGRDEAAALPARISA